MLHMVVARLPAGRVDRAGEPQNRAAPFTDADLAGCPYTLKSTTGIHIALGDTRSHFPMVGVSKRQGSTVVSTPEAELVAGNHGLRYELLPIMDVCDLILNKN